jgi:hypothetical protein
MLCMKTKFKMALLIATVCLAGCRTRPLAPHHADVYEYVAQVLAMPSCRATMLRDCTCFAEFRSADRRTFYIGSPGASPEVEAFIGTLHEGTIYYLPDAFMQFLRENKVAEDGAANGSQPILSETNSTSGAAGSRR